MEKKILLAVADMLREAYLISDDSDNVKDPIIQSAEKIIRALAQE